MPIMPMSIEEILDLPAAVPPRSISEALGLSLDSTYAAIHNGDIPALEVGRLKFVPKTWLLKELEITAGIES
jgi:hypothetical protein